MHAVTMKNQLCGVLLGFMMRLHERAATIRAAAAMI